jgi:hypothetical protein
LCVASRAAAGVVIAVAPPLPDAGSRIRVSVTGEWADACPPQLQSVRLEGQDIVLSSQVAASSCSGPGQDYQDSSENLPEANLRLTRNAVYRIRHEIRRGENATPELHGFRLLHVGHSPDAGFVPESGYWWPERGGEFDHAGPGLGLQMEAQAGTLSLTSFGYDARGEATWQFGAGQINGRTAQVELSRFTGGSGPFDSYRAPTGAEAAGIAHVELLSPSRATIWFARARDGEIEVRPISMVRFRFAQEAAEAWLGRWVVLAESDEAYPTRRIDFVEIQRQDEGFSLVDSEARNRLDCRLAARQPNSPPVSCRLIVSEPGGDSIEFRDVALNELRGWNGAGQRIVGLKLRR